MKTHAVYLGQYLGIALLVGLSVVGSLLGNFVDNRYIGLLGLFPIYLGIRQVSNLFHGEKKEEPGKERSLSGAGWLSVALVTFANGGDNIGVYIPIFATLAVAELFLMISIFFLMVFLWLLVARYLASHPVAAASLSRYGHIITPLVLCLLGLYILKEHNSYQFLDRN